MFISQFGTNLFIITEYFLHMRNSDDEKAHSQQSDAVQPFSDAIAIANEDEQQNILMEDEKGASVSNPNVNDNRRLFQARVFHVDFDLSVQPQDQPDLLAAHGPVDLD